MNFYEEEEQPAVRRRRRNEPDFWHTLNRVVAALVLLGILITVGVVFYPVWQRQQDMRSALAALEGKQAEKTALLAKSQREIDLLRNDPEYLETIARDRLNLMKPGETIFRVEIPRQLASSVQP
jgi:cell division protein FtsB